MSNLFSAPTDAIAAIARGEIVIVLDAEDRENEGDFICAAEKISRQAVNFMITHGRGLLCMPISEDIADRLGLSRLVMPDGSPCDTPMAMPIDHCSCRTGITASERATTILQAIDPASKPEDFRVAGHVMPLIARDGGVLERPGHTEATVDLARLAGLTPAGALCEVLDPEGERATADDLVRLSRQWQMPLITIDQLIQYQHAHAGAAR